MGKGLRFFECRIIHGMMIILFIAGILSGCSGTGEDKKSAKLIEGAGVETGSNQPKAKKQNPVMLRLLLNSPELTEQYYDMAKEYNREFQDTTLDLTILQNDYQTVLKSRLNSGDIPDVFITGAYYENKVYRDYSCDLTNEDFINQIDPSALKTVTLDGKITGYPFLFQAHSFIYNKKVFSEAGISGPPKTLKELEEICKKLSLKGIQPFATGFGEWWVLEQVATQYMVGIKDSYSGDYVKFADELNAGRLAFGDIKELDGVFDIIDLQLKYGGTKPMNSDFASQCQLLASGKAAMIHQGTWAEETIRKANPHTDVGFFAAPGENEFANPGIMVDSNLCMRIYKDSKQREAALDWMRWLITSKYGEHWIPEKCRQISTIKGASIPKTQLAQDTMEFIRSSKAYPWFKGYYVDGFEQQLGLSLQAYAAGNKTRQQVKDELSQTYKRLSRQSLK
ncbi:MAG: extracellular solute-binding protein [Clostridia bacterium]|nr:extracellular solute-binding protein [Clostridia bacterium]